MQKRKLILSICLAIGLVGCQESSKSNQTDRYPWQITRMADGGSRIFGIHLRVTTAEEARRQLGIAMKLALFENADGRLSLEMFYNEFTRAGLTGKLVLTLGDDAKGLQSLKEQALKKEKLESGVAQYILAADANIAALPVVAMTYIPYTNLDEPMILARFGEPAEKIRTHEQAQHWLYPEQGLDLIVNDVGKEILQYVAPGEFARLTRPLRP